jgi:hypothetical protein
MRPADVGKRGEFSRRGGVTAGQTAREALPFRQFDQSGHPRPIVFVGGPLFRHDAGLVPPFPVAIRKTPASNSGGSAKRRRKAQRTNHC